jgi:predicted DNA-binding WGR domain protein
MNAITLTRKDTSVNMRRFYHLDVQPDLFGAWCCIREWGRIGQAGQTRSVPYSTMCEAQAELERQRFRKEHRGYIAQGAGRDS